MYTANAGDVVTQGPGGVPVAIPMETTGIMVAAQTATTSPREGQPRLDMVPVSGAGAKATGNQSQQVEMPSSYGKGQCMTQQHAQV